MKVSIYEQECFGVIHWRVMRDDGDGMIFSRHHTDFETCDDAVGCVQAEFRRKRLSGTIKIYRRYPFRFGQELTETIEVEAKVYA